MPSHLLVGVVRILDIPDHIPPTISRRNLYAYLNNASAILKWIRDHGINLFIRSLFVLGHPRPAEPAVFNLDASAQSGALCNAMQ
jgi:hypothetical protein